MFIEPETLRLRIIDRYEPWELIEALGLTTEDLHDILIEVIMSNLDKLDVK